MGNRGAPRVRTESPVPVDVIKVNQIGETTAKPDLMSQLNMAVPSFNYNKQSGGDGSDAIDFASLRGLGFDQTLVLINGKRRHLSAFVNQVGTRGRGNSGTDLNAIPEAAIDRIEILRDGASAQYGSDAIAGVINIILKKGTNKLTASLTGGGYANTREIGSKAVKSGPSRRMVVFHVFLGSKAAFRKSGHAADLSFGMCASVGNGWQSPTHARGARTTAEPQANPKR